MVIETQIINDGRILGIPVQGEPSALTPNLFYNSITQTFEWVVGGGNAMGDLEYIESKVIAGDYFQVNGPIAILNDTIEYIVPVGKTAFLIEAKIINTLHSAPSQNTGLGTNALKDMITASLIVDAVTKDKTTIGMSSQSGNVNFGGAPINTSSAYGNLGDGKFNVKGISLVGDGAKKIEIKNILDDGSVDAVMSGYLIDT